MNIDDAIAPVESSHHTTFGRLPIGARFVMADSPGGDAKVKTGYERWKWEGHVGFLPVANGCRPERKVIRLPEGNP